MKLRSGILSTFLAKVAVAALGLITVIVISRLLGAEGRGKIGLFMSSVALLQLLCDFGNSSAIINLSYRLSPKNLWISSVLWVGAICFISYPVFLLFDDLSFNYLVSPAAFLLSQINLNQLLLMGKQEVYKRNISLLITPALLIPGFLLFFYQTELGISAYPTALFLALGLSALSARLLLGKFLSNDPFRFESDILKQGFWVQSAQAVQFLNYRLNFFLVAFFISDAALGIYNNAVILCESIWILGHSIGQMQHMKILNSPSRIEHLQLTKKLMFLNLGGTILLSLVLLLIPNSFWTFLFSGEFETMRKLFVFLIPGVIFFSVSNIITHYLHAQNQFKKILYCNAVGLLAGTCASLLLIPSMGLDGAAAAWSIGLLVSMLAYIRLWVKAQAEGA